jgi:predicted TIM-barrel fold metal-dependent hydrolase
VLVARAVLSAPESERHRLHPFITGFNPTDRNAIDHVKRMVEWYPGLWQGIGEILTHHDDLTALTPGEIARPDSIALDPVFDFAAEHDLPVSIHSNIGAVWLHEPVFVAELEAMLKKHSKTRFIWCHAGTSRRIVVPSLASELRRLLGDYRNLWVDLSWVVFENYIAPDGKLQPDWVDLVKAFPDRFMIGSDVVGHYSKYTAEMRKYDLLLDALPEETARRVGHDNFLSVLPAEAREANRIGVSERNHAAGAAGRQP